MKVGDYVRIVDDLGKQFLGKIYNINEYREPSTKYAIDCQIFNDYAFVGDERIVKSSPNIIDLIEVGDYVNGHKVSDIYEDINGQVRMKFGENGLVLAHKSNYDNYYLFEEDIKSIVTKEQFESMEYKVGE